MKMKILKRRFVFWGGFVSKAYTQWFAEHTCYGVPVVITREVYYEQA